MCIIKVKNERERERERGVCVWKKRGEFLSVERKSNCVKLQKTLRVVEVI